MLPAGVWKPLKEARPCPSDADERRSRARLAANRRHHLDRPDLTVEDAAQLEEAALDRHIAEVVARAPRMTPEQADKLRRLFRYVDPDE